MTLMRAIPGDNLIIPSIAPRRKGKKGGVAITNPPPSFTTADTGFNTTVLPSGSTVSTNTINASANDRFVVLAWTLASSNFLGWTMTNLGTATISFSTSGFGAPQVGPLNAQGYFVTVTSPGTVIFNFSGGPAYNNIAWGWTVIKANNFGNWNTSNATVADSLVNNRNLASGATGGYSIAFAVNRVGAGNPINAMTISPPADWPTLINSGQQTDLTNGSYSFIVYSKNPATTANNFTASWSPNTALVICMMAIVKPG